MPEGGRGRPSRRSAGAATPPASVRATANEPLGDEDAEPFARELPTEEIRLLSLRRMLWRACQQDDRDAAFLIYKATDGDWNRWIQLERDLEERRVREAEKLRIEQQRQQQNQLRHGSRRRRQKEEKQQSQQQQHGGSITASLLRPFSGRRVKATTATTTTVATSQSSRQPGDEGTVTRTLKKAPMYVETVKLAARSGPDRGAAVGILQRHMNPSECFAPEDYLPLDAPYHADSGTVAHNLWLYGVQRQLQESPRNSNAAGVVVEGGRDPWQARGQSHGRTVLWPFSSRAPSRPTSEAAEPVRSSLRDVAAASADDPATDPRRTTPLHEAARLGHPDLVALMLQHPGADLTERNGEQRTPLHCVAGGLTEDEVEWYQHHRLPSNAPRDSQKLLGREGPRGGAVESGQDDDDDADELSPVGIRRPDNMLDPPPSMSSSVVAPVPRTKRSSRFGRFLRTSTAETPDSSEEPNKNVVEPEHSPSLDAARIDVLERDRQMAAVTLLNWSHPDDGSPLSGLGVSVNAVDVTHGRTALHYAAELGRTDICLAISESFGANLTIVDDRGKTPCELAAEHGMRQAQSPLLRPESSRTKSLAAQLEARALLHVDYDSMMNEDLVMTSILSQQRSIADESRQRLVPPFGWFETKSLQAVQSTRAGRLSTAEDKIKELVRLEIQELASRQAMFDADSSSDNDDGVHDDADHVGGAHGRRGPDLPETPQASSTEAASKPPAKLGEGSIDNPIAAESSITRGDKTAETLGSTAVPDREVAPSGGGTEKQQSISSANVDACRNSNTGDDDAARELQLEPSNDRARSASPATASDASESPCDAQCSSVRPAPSVALASSSEPPVVACSSDVKESQTASTIESSDSNSRIHTATSADTAGTASTVRDKSSIRNAAMAGQDFDPLLGIHRAHVQQFLHAHGWDVHKALSAFVQDSRGAFRNANVALPTRGTTESSISPTGTLECLICCDEFESRSDWTTLESCGHSFCRDCLGGYISNLAKSKSGLIVPCPHHECHAPMTGYEVASLAPSMEVYEALLNTANEDFVVGAKDFTFCPHPSCTGIVQFQAPDYVKKSGMDPALLHIVGAVCTATHPSKTIPDGCRLSYEGVWDPNYTNALSTEPRRKAHRFCFACGDLQFHWPVTCDRLSKWKQIVKEQVSQVKQPEGTMDSDYNDIAQELWLKTYTRPCPKCKAPVEKVDGCNHMTCSNPRCKHEYCWICRNDWSLHNTQTGGFYRCNRWVDQKDEHEFYDAPPEDPQAALNVTNEDLADPNTMAVTYGTAIHSSLVARKRQKEMARFLHHYQRWSAHAESAALESKMSESAPQRLAPVVEAAMELDGSPDFSFDDEGLSFVYDAFTELLECRTMLQNSYAHSYFRYDLSTVKRSRALKRRMTEKAAFEQSQAELEMLAEQLSNVVARSHLRATQSQIKYLTFMTAEKRKEFSNMMLSVHMAERKEDEEHDSKPEFELRGEIRETILRLQRHAGVVLPRNDRLQTETVPTTLLSHRRAGSSDTDAAVASEGSGLPRTAGIIARPQEHHRGNSIGTDGAVNGSVAPSVGEGRGSVPFMADFAQASDDAFEEAIRVSLQEFNAVRSAAASILEQVQNEEEGTNATQEWACVACTFVNRNGRRCAMCRTRRAG